MRNTDTKFENPSENKLVLQSSQKHYQRTARRKHITSLLSTIWSQGPTGMIQIQRLEQEEEHQPFSIASKISRRGKNPQTRYFQLACRRTKPFPLRTKQLFDLMAILVPRGGLGSSHLLII